MARYQREFLVPYLRDVCALHLALHKMQERLDSLDYRKRALERGVHSGEKPREPFYDPANGVFAIVCGVFTFFFSFVMFWLNIDFLGWFMILGSIIEVIFGAVRYGDVTKENSNKKEAYDYQLAEYQEIQRKNEKARQSIPSIVNEMRECRLEMERVEDALRRVYYANVIPRHYRNMYAAVFLYDWFSTGRSDDLDMALNMFVLEEIKEKLDRIIANQKEIILNQYLQLAEQRRSLELQEEHASMMESKLNQINASNEERNTYLAMIESNTATTAYFATANYLTRL